MLIFFAILVGTVAGTIWVAIAPVGAEVVGLQDLPSALSIFWLALVLPATFSEPIALELRQKTGKIYQHAQLYAGFMYIGAALCMWALRAWKIGEVEARAVEKGASDRESCSAEAMPQAHRCTSREIAEQSAGFMRRLVQWKKV